MTESGSARHAGRPRRAVLDRERIAEAAMAIVDESGDFTVPELARRLGVQTASIYHYVDGRAGVIELLRGRIGRLADPAPLELRPAEVALRAYFRSYRDLFAAHARVLPLLATSTVRSPEVIPIYERVTVLMREVGVPAEDVMTVLTAMENLHPRLGPRPGGSRGDVGHPRRRRSAESDRGAGRAADRHQAGRPRLRPWPRHHAQPHGAPRRTGLNPATPAAAAKAPWPARRARPATRRRSCAAAAP